MTHEQASLEFARLCESLGHSPDKLKDAQVASWLKALRSLPYERGRAAIDATVRKWEYSSFPPVGFFNKRAEGLSTEGTPNAIPYSQDSSRTPWSQTQEAAFAVWRQERIVLMEFPIPLPEEPKEFVDEEARINAIEQRYWAYVHDQDGYRRRCELKWRSMWKPGAA